MQDIEYVSDQDEHAGLIFTVNGGYIAIDDHDTLIWPANRGATTPCFLNANEARSAVLRHFNDHSRTRRGLRSHRQAALFPARSNEALSPEPYLTGEVGPWTVVYYRQEPIEAKGGECYVCASLGRSSQTTPLVVRATTVGSSLTRYYHAYCFTLSGRDQLKAFYQGSPRMA